MTRAEYTQYLMRQLHKQQTKLELRIEELELEETSRSSLGLGAKLRGINEELQRMKRQQDQSEAVSKAGRSAKLLLGGSQRVLVSSSAVLGMKFNHKRKTSINLL